MIATQKEKKTSEWQQALSNHKKNNLKEPLFIITDLFPEDADYLLEENDNNRHLHVRTVDRYKRFMSTGKWQLNGECIKIGSDGSLLDGQHRLEALKQLNKPIRVSLAIGVEPKTFAINDTGRSRTAGDILSIAGYKNVNNNAAALRYLLWYKESETFTARVDVSPSDVLAAIKKWPHIKHFVYPSIEYKHLIPSSVIQFFMYVTQSIDSEKSFLFFSKLLTGDGLEKKSAILQLREMLLKHKILNVHMDKRHNLACLILAWNAFIEDRVIKTVKWNGVGFPLVNGVDREKLFKRHSGFGAKEYNNLAG